MFVLDRENGCPMHLLYDGAIGDQPLFEFEIWQVFQNEYLEFKIEKDKEQQAEIKAKTQGMRRR
jgi:hypothetical protein